MSELHRQIAAQESQRAADRQRSNTVFKAGRQAVSEYVQVMRDKQIAPVMVYAARREIVTTTRRQGLLARFSDALTIDTTTYTAVGTGWMLEENYDSDYGHYASDTFIPSIGLIKATWSEVPQPTDSVSGPRREAPTPYTRTIRRPAPEMIGQVGEVLIAERDLAHLVEDELLYGSWGNEVGIGRLAQRVILLSRQST